MIVAQNAESIIIFFIIFVVLTECAFINIFKQNLVEMA